LIPVPDSIKIRFMKRMRPSGLPWLSLLFGFLIQATVPTARAEEPTPAAVSGFNSYISEAESRLAHQHRSVRDFLVPEDADRLHRGDLIIDQLTPSSGGDLPDAMLHHWRGTAFAAGATAADFERLMRDFNAYPQRFAPQVIRATVISQRNDHFQATMRVRQKHVITVVMDTTYDIVFGRLDAKHGYSTSRSARISEIDSPGTPRERALSSSEEHGFLWRLNTYWSCEERDHGLYMQIESVSLTRAIPTGLAWAIGPFVESVPRESLEFTLRATRNALQKQGRGQ
jgi:hypothetical protein